MPSCTLFVFHFTNKCCNCCPLQKYYASRQNWSNKYVKILLKWLQATMLRRRGWVGNYGNGQLNIDSVRRTTIFPSILPLLLLHLNSWLFGTLLFKLVCKLISAVFNDPGWLKSSDDSNLSLVKFKYVKISYFFYTNLHEAVHKWPRNCNDDSTNKLYLSRLLSTYIVAGRLPLHRQKFWYFWYCDLIKLLPYGISTAIVGK